MYLTKHILTLSKVEICRLDLELWRQRSCSRTWKTVIRCKRMAQWSREDGNLVNQCHLGQVVGGHNVQPDIASYLHDNRGLPAAWATFIIEYNTKQDMMRNKTLHCL